MQIYEAIKKIIVELVLTQVKFTQKFHVSFSTVSRLENGRVNTNRLATIMINSFVEETAVNNDAVSLSKST